VSPVFTFPVKPVHIDGAFPRPDRRKGKGETALSAAYHGRPTIGANFRPSSPPWAGRGERREGSTGAYFFYLAGEHPPLPLRSAKGKKKKEGVEKGAARVNHCLSPPGESPPSFNPPSFLKTLVREGRGKGK